MTGSWGRPKPASSRAARISPNPVSPATRPANAARRGRSARTERPAASRVVPKRASEARIVTSAAALAAAPAIGAHAGSPAIAGSQGTAAASKSVARSASPARTGASATSVCPKLGARSGASRRRASARAGAAAAAWTIPAAKPVAHAACIHARGIPPPATALTASRQASARHATVATCAANAPASDHAGAAPISCWSSGPASARRAASGRQNPASDQASLICIGTRPPGTAAPSTRRRATSPSSRRRGERSRDRAADGPRASPRARGASRLRDRGRSEPRLPGA